MAKRGKIQELENVNDVHRPLRIRKYQYLYLIVCEDENTEKVYFQSFQSRIPKETIYLTAVGTGLDPLGVVNRAIVERKNLESLCRKDVDKVWVVFDKDDADLNATRILRFNKAFSIATQERFDLAYSNEVFELWLLLHLTDVDPNVPLPRAFIYEELQRLIRTHDNHKDFVYIHGNEAILEVINKIGDEQAAFDRADRLIAHHTAKDPLTCNPVTQVGLLVGNLYELITYWSYQG